MNCQICDTKQSSKICKICWSRHGKFCNECKEMHLRCVDPHNPSIYKRAIKRRRFLQRKTNEKIDLAIEAIRLKVLPSFVYHYARPVAFPVKRIALDVSIPHSHRETSNITQYWYFHQAHESRILPCLAIIAKKYDQTLAARIRGFIEPQPSKNLLMSQITWMINGQPLYLEHVSNLPSDMDKRLARLTKLGPASYRFIDKAIPLYKGIIIRFLDNKTIAQIIATSKDAYNALQALFFEICCYHNTYNSTGE